MPRAPIGSVTFGCLDGPLCFTSPVSVVLHLSIVLYMTVIDAKELRKVVEIEWVGARPVTIPKKDWCKSSGHV
jgi:hypothetical protein